MEATEVAHNAEGEITLVQIDGRGFVHGSILDHECAKRDAEINQLRAALKIAVRVVDLEGLDLPQWVWDLYHLENARSDEQSGERKP